MEKAIVRLDLLRLTYAHSREPAEAVSRAKVLESYIFGDQQKKTEDKHEKGHGQKKNAGNSILD